MKKSNTNRRRTRSKVLGMLKETLRESVVRILLRDINGFVSLTLKFFPVFNFVILRTPSSKTAEATAVAYEYWRPKFLIGSFRSILLNVRTPKGLWRQCTVVSQT